MRHNQARSNQHREEKDVIVCGAGLVGLSLALNLGLQGFKVLVIEAKPLLQSDYHPESPCDSRVVAISKNSARFFETIGIWKTLLNFRMGIMEHIKVWDQGQGQVNFSKSDALSDNLGYIIEQSNIIQALMLAIAAMPNIKVQDQTKIIEFSSNANFVHCILDNGQMIQAKLLAGCDGVSSWVRETAKIKTHVRPYHQKALVATLQTEHAHHNRAYQRFSPSGPLVYLPLYHPNQVSIVWSMDMSMSDSILQCDEQTFSSKVASEMSHVLGHATLISDRLAFPISERHANCYTANRLVLLGDAAHSFHPLAGQGVNFGFKDVQALVSVLKDAKHKNRDIGLDYLLKRFERKRRYHNQLMIYFMRAFKEGFGNKTLTSLEFFRNEAFDWVDHKPTIKRWFAAQALN